jgi:hypothetical protein
MKMAIFWNAAAYNPAESDGSFGDAYCFLHQGHGFHIVFRVNSYYFLNATLTN